MKSRSVKEILSEAMPEMEIIEPVSRAIDASDSSDAALPTRPGPSIEALRAKFLGKASTRAVAAQDHGKNDLENDDREGDVEVFQVRPKASSTDFSVPSSPKTVIVSKTKGIIGRQG